MGHNYQSKIDIQKERQEGRKKERKKERQIKNAKEGKQGGAGKKPTEIKTK